MSRAVHTSSYRRGAAMLADPHTPGSTHPVYLSGAQGLDLRPGDILLIHTGWARHRPEATPHPGDRTPGTRAPFSPRHDAASADAPPHCDPLSCLAPHAIGSDVGAVGRPDPMGRIWGEKGQTASRRRPQPDWQNRSLGCVFAGHRPSLPAARRSGPRPSWPMATDIRSAGHTG
jgi:hypothetical protein